MKDTFRINWKKIKDSMTRITAAKIAVGAVLAILAAQRFGLEYASSAGVITLLSIMNTRKETFVVAAKRCVAFAAAMLLANLTFAVLGYEVWAFGVFLLLFYMVVCALDVKEGFSMNAVLVTHLLSAGGFAWAGIVNEAGLFVIGVAAAIFVNSYMPDRTLRIRDHQRRIENKMRNLLRELAEALASGETGMLGEHIKETAAELKQMERDAVEQADNSFQRDELYFVKYVEMRMNQIEVLENMEGQLRHITCVMPQALKMAEFFRHTGETFHETNNAHGLLDELYALRAEYKQSRLPDSREEFENRAILFHILQLMEYFLKLKQKFADRMSEEEKKRFWDVDPYKKSN